MFAKFVVVHFLWFFCYFMAAIVIATTIVQSSIPILILFLCTGSSGYIIKINIHIKIVYTHEYVLLRLDNQ